MQTWLKGVRQRDVYWKRWRDEYLLSLREHHQWEVKQRGRVSDVRPKVGDVVHVREDVPRGMWKLARIEELHNSTDGLVRAATLRLAQGKGLYRSVADLFPLELEAPPERT